MALKIKNIQNKLSKISKRDLIYPGVIIVFFIIISIIFYVSVKFLTKNINDAFWGGSEVSTTLLNTENYNIIAKKLNIETSNKNTNTSTLNNVSHAEEVETQQPSSPIIDKNSVTITILNSTTKAGLAGALATQFKSIGFEQTTAGNESKAYTTTTIRIKESIATIGPTIIEEVKKTYPNTTIETAPETADFDVTIIIGSK